MIRIRKNTDKILKTKHENRRGYLCHSIFPTNRRASLLMLRKMPLDDMLNLSNEITQYVRGIKRYSDCSSQTKKYMRLFKKDPMQSDDAKMALKVLNEQIIARNKIECSR